MFFTILHHNLFDDFLLMKYSPIALSCRRHLPYSRKRTPVGSRCIGWAKLSKDNLGPRRIQFVSEPHCTQSYRNVPSMHLASSQVKETSGYLQSVRWLGKIPKGMTARITARVQAILTTIERPAGQENSDKMKNDALPTSPSTPLSDRPAGGTVPNLRRGSQS